MWFFNEEFDETPSSANFAADFSSAVQEPFSLTRASSGMGRDTDGRWMDFAANIARPWRHPVTQDRPYILVEPERTQLVYRSRQPVLTNVQGTSSVDAAVQTPFGTGAVKFVPNTTSTQHGWNLFFGNAAHATAIAENTTLALTAVMRPTGAYTDVMFFLLNKTGIYSTVRVSLTGAGSVVSQSGVISVEISRDTDSFYTITMVNNYQAGTSTTSFNGGFLNQDGTRTFAGDGTSGFYLAYIGAEIGTETTSPIITPTTVPVTRAADILTASTGWLQTGDKSIGLNYIPMGRARDTILSVTGTDQITLSNDTGTVSLSGVRGGQETIAISGSAPLTGVDRTVVVVLGSTGASMSQNGLVVGTDDQVSGVPGTFSALRIGAGTDGSSAGPVLVRLLKFWGSPLAQDAALTYSRDLSQDFEEPDRQTVSVQPTLSVPPGPSSVSLTVVVAGNLAGTVVSYHTVNDTAVAGVHFLGASGTVVIPPGETFGIISVGLLGRDPVTDRKFRIVLDTATQAIIGAGVCEILLIREVPAGSSASTSLTFGATLPADISLSRASAAWTRNSTGVWTSVASNGYRRHYLSASVSGFLIEPAPAEQRLFDSVDPTFAASGGTRALVTSETTPTGNRYLQFRENTALSAHGVTATLTSANSDMPAGDVTVTVIIRPVSRRYVTLTLKGIDNISQSVTFDLSDAGAVLTAGVINPVSIERDAFRNTWYEISFSRAQASSAGVSAVLSLTSSDVNRSTSVQGATTSGFDICHVQLTPGVGKSSPILVTAASAKTVRAADIVKATGTWHQRQTYSLGMRFRRLSDHPATQRLWMAKDVSGQVGGVTVQNGVMVADAPAATILSLDPEDDPGP
jgi:hypothetical protein